MDFKVFMDTVKREIENMKTESELREWIQNYARTIPGTDRESFLRQFQKKEYYTHEQELEEFEDWCEKIDEGELLLTCEGHEDYDAEYWGGDDWVYDYEDPEGIADDIMHFYQIAEQCIYDKDYNTAHQILEMLVSLRVVAIDEYAEEELELNLEELVAENLLKLDLKKMSALTLYSAYQVFTPEERLERFYHYFYHDMFRDTKLEDMLSVGMEALKQVDEFMELWITYLRGQRDRYTARLLKEAVLYLRGEEGLVEEAKCCANVHPILLIQVLESFFNSGSWERLLQEGKIALQMMNREMEIRGNAARLTAAGARGMENSKEEAYAYFEAFYSESSAANYLRLIICEKVTDKMREDALIRGKNLGCVGAKRKYGQIAGSVFQNTQQYEMDKETSLFIDFYSQQFEKVLSICKRKKEYLGWTGDFIGTMVPLMLALLHGGETFRPATLDAVTSASKAIYKEKYDEPDFITAYRTWKKQVNLTENMEKDILQFLQKMIDGRVNAIVSGGHRASYYKAARLGAALGEVEETLGVPDGKAKRIQGYFQQFPRHRAFKQEMEKYVQG